MHCPPSIAHNSPGEEGVLEPAVGQLRTLPPGDLTALVLRWLAALGLDSVQPCGLVGCGSTFEARLPSALLCVPVRIRVHQRKNRLQLHHVEAFLGHLVRSGSPLGVLVTTGECTREATAAARASHSPRIRLVTGNQWVAELAVNKSGVKRRSLWRWIVDRSLLLAPPPSERRRGA